MRKTHTTIENQRFLFERRRIMVPVQRSTRTQGRNRRSHDALTTRHSTACPDCQAAKLPHAACTACGYVRPGLKLNLAKKD